MDFLLNLISFTFSFEIVTRPNVKKIAGKHFFVSLYMTKIWKNPNGERAHEIVAAAPAQQHKKIAAHSARRLNRNAVALQLRAIKPSPRKQY